MTKKNKLYVLLLVVLSVAVSFFYYGAKPSMKELKISVAPAASLYPDARSVSDKLNFINDASADTHLSEVAQGKWALLYFGYASCPDICPIDLSKINLTYQMMDNQERLQVVFVSVDPGRDIGRLDQFAGAFNPSFAGLTAKQDELVLVSRSLGVYHEVVASQTLAKEDHSSHGDDPSHSHYEVDHTSSYLLFNPELKLVALLTSPHEPEAMAKAIDIIIENLR